MEEKALHFDSYSQIYDSVRPGYPQEIYETISNYKNLGTNSNVLEIGAGNGIASQEISKKWKLKMILIEPGENLCELLYDRFKNNKNITVKNTTFEKYQTEYKFDAIFSATAFHWLDLSIKYKKSYDLLNDDGLLILFWNNYGIENNEIGNEIQKIYTKYGKGIKDEKSPYEKQMEKIESRKIEIEMSNLFNMIEHKIIKNIREYTKENYIQLLKTFSDHSEMEEGFFEEIRETIKKHGNKIEVRILVNLEIASKK
jgi:SAM-dependent methyltransferase